MLLMFTQCHWDIIFLVKQSITISLLTEIFAPLGGPLTSMQNSILEWVHNRFTWWNPGCVLVAVMTTKESWICRGKAQDSLHADLAYHA